MHRWNRVSIGSTIAFIAAFTLFPTSDSVSPIGFACVLCGERVVSDLILNVVLFIPLGSALALAGVAPLRGLVIGLVLATTIEFVQVLLPGRYSALRDIITNGAGAWLGVYLTIHFRSWLAVSPLARVRLWSATVAALILVGSTGWLLRASPTSGDYYWSQWAPELENLGHWSGEVHSAAIVGQSKIARGRSASKGVVRELRTAPLRVIVTAGSGRHEKISPIFALADSDQRHILMISQQDDDITVRTLRRSSRLGLDTPSIRFTDAFAAITPGDSAVIEVHGAFAEQTCLAVNDSLTCAGRRSAGSLWTLLVSRRSLEGGSGRVLDALTLFVLSLPAGLLFGAVPRVHAFAATALLLAGLAIIAPLNGLAVPSAPEFATVLAALAAGIVCHSRARVCASDPGYR